MNVLDIVETYLLLNKYHNREYVTAYDKYETVIPEIIDLNDKNTLDRYFSIHIEHFNQFMCKPAVTLFDRGRISVDYIKHLIKNTRISYKSYLAVPIYNHDKAFVKDVIESDDTEFKVEALFDLVKRNPNTCKWALEAVERAKCGRRICFLYWVVNNSIKVSDDIVKRVIESDTSAYGYQSCVSFGYRNISIVINHIKNGIINNRPGAIIGACDLLRNDMIEEYELDALFREKYKRLNRF